MKIIGITGGIGSGKSTVCRLFAEQGIAIYDADSRAKWVIENNESLVLGIKKIFGENAYLPKGIYNRQYISAIVFKQPEKLAQLNSIVHPAVKQDFIDWLATKKENYAHSFVLKEAAILYEAGTDKNTDAVIAVYAPKKIRIERVRQRDNLGVDEILARMQRQWADAKKMQKADFVIYNDGKHGLMPQVSTILRQLAHQIY